MENFKFSLQKLLDIRIDKEEESKINFKKAQQEKVTAEQNLEKLNNNYKKFSEERKYGSIVQQKITQAYLSSLSGCIDRASMELNNKTSVLEQKRRELKDTQIERKTVEILRDKQKDKFIKEQNRIEQKTNDEFALYGFIRRNSEGR
ncbi:flagellar export protein FliJ [Clostridium pasteurianum DSM 525 = ATCC 6013]|uniref:Flagellar FliJ protein n=1 Tax=Clostridium pasteurianum DSM 525 = ATCC 6013 TaxID=1262449 RepID=A0A0H3J350_CLOPA|nr:flagellar export protein FliJ [Clostridium pasteurianum]AJA47889.1 flagellar export protein FliJ [Clostridium pasteurianum DSM 525 = ATCC 6013]AJA51877.1 flagellar export protein FliJ [Clostridium pasteurianum DSM 525 = ATCC 6013]AOZ75179.1 flagellar biosynthesis protein FliJ [Clostridium pasteurianum DSM 525 = ATCC 6013]AOZ78974.1 flagellar biosynthesis protein FliJ [Clostridium pasteurianum]ELP59792.1 flagellar protein FliJ [Clostridium pasteurianum DSM 525 = ATCC 6013]